MAMTHGIVCLNDIEASLLKAPAASLSWTKWMYP